MKKKCDNNVKAGDLLLQISPGMEMFNDTSPGGTRILSAGGELLFVIEPGVQMLYKGTKTKVLTTNGVFYVPIWSHGKRTRLVSSG